MASTLHAASHPCGDLPVRLCRVLCRLLQHQLCSRVHVLVSPGVHGMARSALYSGLRLLSKRYRLKCVSLCAKWLSSVG